MSQETITLFHSTDKDGLEATQEIGCLFGCEWIKPHPGYSGGSNLTPDKTASQNFIRSERGQGQWTNADGPPELFTLTFQVPNSLVTPVGTTRYLGCAEFASTMSVDTQDLPDQYLEKLHAGTGLHRMTRETASRLEAQGKIRFYAVPLDYLQSTEPVEYTYNGVTYPIVSSGDGA